MDTKRHELYLYMVRTNRIGKSKYSALLGCYPRAEILICLTDVNSSHFICDMVSTLVLVTWAEAVKLNNRVHFLQTESVLC